MNKLHHPMDPDGSLITTFCTDVAPQYLHDVCQVELAQAEAIGQDVLTRATDFAALDPATQGVLTAPFIEEVTDYDPPEATAFLKAAVTVVVRNSLLEDAHAHGPVNSDGLRYLTGMAAAPLSHLLAARRQDPVPPTADNQFLGLMNTYPRAWACLTALAAGLAAGGRTGYRSPDAPVPELPAAAEQIQAEPAKATSGTPAVILSAIEPRFDQELIAGLQHVTKGVRIVWVPKLSHFSRNQTKLLRIMEFVLAHGASVLTTNYLLRPTDVWVRRKPLVPPTNHDPQQTLADQRGLAGAHRATVEDYVRELKASEG